MVAEVIDDWNQKRQRQATYLPQLFVCFYFNNLLLWLNRAVKLILCVLQPMLSER